MILPPAKISYLVLIAVSCYLKVGRIAVDRLLLADHPLLVLGESCIDSTLAGGLIDHDLTGSAAVKQGHYHLIVFHLMAKSRRTVYLREDLIAAVPCVVAAHGDIAVMSSDRWPAQLIGIVLGDAVRQPAEYISLRNISALITFKGIFYAEIAVHSGDSGRSSGLHFEHVHLKGQLLVIVAAFPHFLSQTEHLELLLVNGLSGGILWVAHLAVVRPLKGEITGIKELCVLGVHGIPGDIVITVMAKPVYHADYALPEFTVLRAHHAVFVDEIKSVGIGAWDPQRIGRDWL